MILKTLHVFALAVWLGGLTFYALVVIPVGADVLVGIGEETAAGAAIGARNAANPKTPQTTIVSAAQSTNAAPIIDIQRIVFCLELSSFLRIDGYPQRMNAK